MPIKFTRHALQQMQNRGIHKDEVKEAVNNPDKVVKNSGNNLIAQKLIEKKLLRVFYRTEGKDKVIITAYKTSKIEKYFQNVPTNS